MNDSKRVSATVGVFDSATAASGAIHDLRDAGFSDTEIGLLARDDEGRPEVRPFRELEGNQAARGAAVGAAAGAGSGALWALGVAAGVVPAIGPVVAGGLLIALAATAAAGAGAGVIVGTLVGLGIRDEDAAYYTDELRQGRTILVVQDAKRADLAQTILLGRGGRVRRGVRPSTLAEHVALTQS